MPTPKENLLHKRIFRNAASANQGSLHPRNIFKAQKMFHELFIAF